jgi:hypothetical protein
LTIVLIVIAALIVLIALWFILTFNSLVRLRNEVAQGLSSIDVQLKRRADLIPNLVEAVKGYAQHETAAFESVSNARAKALGATTLDEKAAADGEVQAAVGKLFAIAEAYPELRAVESFTQLQRARGHRGQDRRGPPVLQHDGSRLHHEAADAAHVADRRRARAPSRRVLPPRGRRAA